MSIYTPHTFHFIFPATPEAAEAAARKGPAAAIVLAPRTTIMTPKPYFRYSSGT